MSELDSTYLQQYKTFLGLVSASGKVWVLEHADGFATSTSNQFEDEEGEPVELLCFWAEEFLAAKCAQDDWADYEPIAIDLADFIENWCTGMSNDGILAGIDFDNEMNGHEVDPLEMVIDLSEELKKQKKTVELQNFKSLQLFVDEVNKILEG